MLFNSLEFLIFFLIVYGLYICLNLKGQNRLLLIASYWFYGSWDWRFLSLIIISTLVDYFCGIMIHESADVKKRRRFLFCSIFVNLSILGFFKYCDFFVSSFQALLINFGISLNPTSLNIILPVGISFYTFQTMSYTIDIYRKEMVPTKKFLDFALFVSFFPQLVAGPIERAKRLLPQILNQRSITVEGLYKGIYLIIWGLFQKVFIADNLAKIVDPVFASLAPYNGFEVIIAVYAFAIQIFCDFAGYSNIAIGLGKCMGINLMTNFNLPYFSKNPSEFWQRWHISLSSWLKDYLYIPLGGNRKGQVRTICNLMITMLLGGLWHGASWTFVLWGGFHGILLIVYRVGRSLFAGLQFNITGLGKYILDIIRTMIFFHLVCLGWLFFRCQSLTQVFDMIRSVFTNLTVPSNMTDLLLYLFYFIAPLLIIQFLQYAKNNLFVVLTWRPYQKTAFFLTLMYLCFYVMILGRDALIGGGGEFIYFQF